jgi:hypothetical protein
MDAVRCLDCGGTRWTFLAGSLARLLSEPCETCGGEVVLERRRPGARRARAVVERRQAERSAVTLARAGRR